jgi:uncharacterized protein
MAQLTYPGVYIDEVPPAAPIEGVGTSTAAFIGPTSDGPPNEARKLTSWDAFRARYGDPLEGFYLWYAVRGFFENGGTVCYVVRASTAAYDEATLIDQSASDTIVVRARALGDNNANPLKIAASAASPAITGKKVFQPPTVPITNAAAGSTQVEAAAADASKLAQYRPGDTVAWTGGSGVVARVSGTTLSLVSPPETAPAGSLRLADLAAGDARTFRIQSGGEKLGPGSIVHLSQTVGGNTVQEDVVVKRVTEERITPALTTYRVDLRGPVANAYDMTKNVVVASKEFSLTVTQGGGYSKTYANLSMDPDHPQYFADVVAADAAARVVASPASPPSTSRAPLNQPATTVAAANLTGGAADVPANLAANHYATALKVLEAIDDVNLVVAPDRQDPDVQAELIAHCELLMDRFAILDSRRGADLFGPAGVEGQRAGVTSANGYAALYYPWLEVPPASGTRRVLVPPSGHVAGVYARIDARRGVHKAPAGEEATVNGALAVEKMMSDVDQGQLNLQGVNVIRVFRPGGRPVVWGARTTASNKGWQYVNIRRLFEYIEESVQEGINWAVFEPNDLQLWQKLRRTISDFLTKVWRDGALFGATPEQAFYVRIDEALNPFAQRQLGRLTIEIGCQPAYPAEFIVVRIGIWDGGSEITES